MSRLACRVVATLGVIATCNLAAGCGRRWPTVRPTTDLGFKKGSTRIVTVDVLPVDVGLSTRAKYKLTPQQLVPAFDQASRAAIHAMLTKRGYQTAAFVDWDGRYQTLAHGRVPAMSQQDVAGTARALSSYGTAQAQTDSKTLLVPYLPARLGDITKSDATLYVGGYGYVGKDKKITVGKVLLVVVVVVLVAVVVVAMLGGKGGGGGFVKGLGKAAGDTVKVVGHAAGHVVRGLGRATLHVMHDSDAMFHTIDALGRSDTHIHTPLDPKRPAPIAPRKGPSRMYIEMTLIDNQTGRTLWHTRATFRANPARNKDVRTVMHRMLKTLPLVR